MKRIYPVLLAVLLVTSCTNVKKKSNRSSSLDEVTSNNQTSDQSVTSQVITTTSPVTSQGKSETAPTSAGVSKTSQTPSKTTNTSAKTSTSVPSGNLPGGFTFFDPPTNTPIEIKTSLSADDWWNNDLTTDFPTTDWAHIYGHNLTNPDFYLNEEGGLVMDQKYKGFRTPLFHHSGPKLEIRIGISQVNNAGGKPDTSVPTGYFFFYDKNGNYFSNLTHVVEQETITSKTTELKFYVTGDNTENVAYFEFRLAALTFKGQQNYNFGIGHVNVHSWERA